ncbi:hypothetical protein [Streptomyces sviceus]|uniref:hypothetical protein n=1 Tax=Streptomyces sviceus TaxID=285530 RepID=UPI0036EA9528
MSGGGRGRVPVPPYLPYALNAYRVLLIRGTHATRIHTTDPTTRHFLDQVMHAS